MKKAKLDKMFSDPNWRKLNRKSPALEGIYPNFAFRNHSENQTALVVIKAARGDFPAGVIGMSKLNQVKDERQCYIVEAELKDGNFTYVNHETYKNVAKVLKKHNPTQGRFGPYWWLNDKFEYVKPQHSDDCL